MKSHSNKHKQAKKCTLRYALFAWCWVFPMGKEEREGAAQGTFLLLFLFITSHRLEVRHKTKIWNPTLDPTTGPDAEAYANEEIQMFFRCYIWYFSKVWWVLRMKLKWMKWFQTSDLLSRTLSDTKSKYLVNFDCVTTYRNWSSNWSKTF